MSTSAERIDFKGLEAVKLSSIAKGVDSVAIVTLFGAHLVSWTVNGKEQIFLSSIAVFDKSKAIRGGCPIVFPQFGRPEGSEMPQHGFARTSMWNYVENGEEGAFTLQSNEETLKHWPHTFYLNVFIKPSGGRLEITLGVLNDGSEAFKFQSLLHTYFRVPSVDTVKISGFEGHRYKDHLGDQGVRTTPAGEPLGISREVDREYINYPQEKEIVISTGDTKHFSITTKAEIDGEDHPTNYDVVLWNPWIEKAEATADLDDDAYMRYVCVEPGNISGGGSELPAGSSFVIEQTIEVLNP
jgi:glucose-6-phosphate 1-epimerase